MTPPTPGTPAARTTRGAAPRTARARGRSTRSIALVGPGMAAILATGCGYTLRPLWRDDFRTLHVAMFENRTFRRALEFRLTERVADEILARTPYALVPEHEAEVVMEGEIVHVAEAVLSEDVQDQSREERVTTTVEVRLRRRETGALLRQWRVADSSEFVLDFGENLDTAVEQTLADLAEKIVQGLEQEGFSSSSGDAVDPGAETSRPAGEAVSASVAGVSRAR